MLLTLRLRNRLRCRWQLLGSHRDFRASGIARLARYDLRSRRSHVTPEVVAAEYEGAAARPLAAKPSLVEAADLNRCSVALAPAIGAESRSRTTFSRSSGERSVTGRAHSANLEPDRGTAPRCSAYEAVLVLDHPAILRLRLRCASQSLASWIRHASLMRSKA